nr:mRNA surveillance protein pelota [Candidatus Njordarchaeum guaymaensis]
MSRRNIIGTLALSRKTMSVIGRVLTLKIVHRNLKKGTLVLKPENLDDLWILYNVILPGDRVYARTQRRVKAKEETLRQDQGQRVSLYLGIQVEDVFYDPNFNRLRVKGTIVEGPEDLIKIRSYHTLSLEPGAEAKIVKEKWHDYLLKRVKESLESQEKGKVMVVAIEEGEACVAKVGDYGIDVCANITMSIPGKGDESKQRDHIVSEFFSQVYSVVKQNLNDKRIKSIVVAGPGFTKERFLSYLKKDKDIASLCSLESVSNGGLAGVHEVIRRGALNKVLEQVRLVEESTLMDELLRRLGKGEKTVVYGTSDVEKAVSFGAVETLLITDSMLRGAAEEERRKLDELLRNTEKMRGKIKILISASEPGEQLTSLGGIAALLRFKVD